MYKGSCLCGAVHYEIRGDVAYSSNCFCTMCQKQHGAASGPYVNVARADLVFTRGADAITHYTSSPGVARSFCTTCGSTLLWGSEERPDRIAVTLGTFDTPFEHRFDKEFYTENKPHWAS
jgi:hypothetical protein